MAVSFSIGSVTSSSFKVSISGTSSTNRYIRVYVKKTSSGAEVADRKWIDSQGLSTSYTVTGLDAGTNYTVNVAYSPTGSADDSTWVGSQTVTTSGGSTQITYYYAFRYDTTGGTYLKTTSPLSAKDTEGGTIIYTSEADDYMPDGYVASSYDVRSGAAVYGGGRSWTVTSTSYSGCAVLQVYCVANTATYYYAFRYEDENGNWLKTTTIFSDKNSSGGVILYPSDAAAYIPDGYEASSYGVHSGAITYTNGRWVVSSTSQTIPGIALITCKKTQTYDYYIYWFDLYRSSATPYYTSSKTGTTSSTWSFTAPSISKTGYTFEGWCASASGNNGTGSIVVGDQESIELPYYNSRSITLYAKWTVHTYSIYFNANGGSGSMSTMTGCMYPTSYTLYKNQFTNTQTITYNYGYSGKADSTVTASRPFSYWTCNGSTYADQETVQGLTEVDGGRVTMYAQWGNYSVTLPNPIRTGYTFKGWYDASGDYVGAGNATLTGTTDRTLYAQWDVDVIAPTISYSSHTDTSITISLDRNDAATGSWIIEVSRSSSFGSLVTSQTITSTAQTAVTLSGLSPDTTYYIRARHVNGSASATSNVLMPSTRIAQFQWTNNDASNIVAGEDFSSMILAAKWNELIDKVDWCRQKSGLSTSGMSDVSAGSEMTAARFNAMRNAIATMNSSVISSKSAGDEIKASYFANASSSLKTTINAVIITL